ncbi:hypothetical protein ACFWBV_06615 [Streptomyces sp. NPDC060030]|uniref:hypothetical protein n=1 Tax=Streptomyces sp. NPDC060030 TaxID=3347042 RepID=UPI00369A2565
MTEDGGAVQQRGALGVGAPRGDALSGPGFPAQQDGRAAGPRPGLGQDAVEQGSLPVPTDEFTAGHGVGPPHVPGHAARTG